MPFALSGIWRLSRLSLQSGCVSAGSLQGIIVQSGRLCVWVSWPIFVSLTICANSLYCLCNPWRPRPPLAPFCVHVQSDIKGGYVNNPFQTRAGKHTHELFTLNTNTKSGTATHTGSRSGRKRPRSLAEELSGEERNDLSCQLDSVNRFLTDLYTHLPIQMFKLRQI